ncbi:MAG: diguanylate cyclase, partial [Cyanobacteria bacterium J06659_2]
LGTLQVAEQIRQVIFDLNIPHRSSQVGERLTVSLGAASIIPRLNHASESLVLAVDQALYKAKQSGRNRVCLAESF